MAGKNIYGSFRRLTNLPLDPTCRFQTKNAAETYINRDHSAYEGQMISVYNDQTNNGIYIVIVDESKQSKKTLLRATDDNKIDQMYEALTALEASFDELSDQLGEDIESRLSAFASQEDLEEIDQKIDNLIGLTNGESLNSALDTIKEISDWIVNHEDLVSTISALNTDLALIKTQNASINGRLNTIDNSITGLENNIAAINNAGYITSAEVNNLVSSYKELSFSDITMQRFTLPANSKIDKVYIHIDHGVDDALFKFYIKNGNTKTVYISSNDVADCNYIDIENGDTNYVYSLNVPLLNGDEVWFEINYDIGHDELENLRGTVGVTYNNLL